jgi:hypothetical protein
MAIGVVCGTSTDTSTEPDVGSNLWIASRFPGARNRMLPSPIAKRVSGVHDRVGVLDLARDGIDLFDCWTNREPQLAVASPGPRRRSYGTVVVSVFVIGSMMFSTPFGVLVAAREPGRQARPPAQQ